VKIFNRRVIAYAPGKCILLGEHAVVYGYPAIAVGISLYSQCRISKVDSNRIELNLIDFKKKFESNNIDNLISLLKKQFPQLARGLQIFSDLVDEEIKDISIGISSSLLSGSGLGSSASIAVAFASAFNEFYGLSLDKTKISDIAYEMEKMVHGTPSGIDNTTCTFGNIIYFKNKKFEMLRIPSDLKLLITYTGIHHRTSDAINKIRKLRENNLELIDRILSDIGFLVERAKNIIQNNELEKLGELMNINQGLLAALGVSNSVISVINQIALNNGAFGSKLTGAGLGGCVVSLGKDVFNIAKVLSDNGFQNFILDIENRGAWVEHE